METNSNATILESTDTKLKVKLPNFYGARVVYGTKDPQILANKEAAVQTLEATHDIVNINLEHYHRDLSNAVERYVKKACATTYALSIGTVVGGIAAGILICVIDDAIRSAKRKRDEKRKQELREILREMRD